MLELLANTSKIEQWTYFDDWDQRIIIYMLINNIIFMFL